MNKAAPSGATHRAEVLDAPLAIISAGMTTVAGDGWAATVKGLETRRTVFAKRPDFIGADFRPQVMGLAAELAGPLTDRLQQLALSAIDDLARRGQFIAACSQTSGAYLVVCLPEAVEAETTAHLSTRAVWSPILDACANRLAAAGLRLDGLQLRCEGPAGVISALSDASNTPEGTDVILIAVDSFACRNRLNRLNRDGRLFSKSNPWGLIPGEAAAALWLRSVPVPQGSPMLVHPSVAVEPVTEVMEQDSLFDGLSRSVQSATRSIETDLTWLYSNANNSRYQLAEISYALHRLPQSKFCGNIEIDYLATRLGDTGTAYVCVQTLLHLAREGSSPALVSAGSLYSGLRGAIAIFPPQLQSG